mmetsp:Transcript_17782/g.41430  ORF Transcript_17782/g.41430 Transcript_17782/m.41430 type:complete len:592 (-) Transcript_17782:153-1928(-)
MQLPVLWIVLAIVTLAKLVLGAAVKPGKGDGVDAAAVLRHAVLRVTPAVATGKVALEIERITADCVPQSAQRDWETRFNRAVVLMLKRNTRDMQRALVAAAESILLLVKSCSCGVIPTLNLFNDWAARMRVYATAHTEEEVGSKVSFQPLKELSVGGVDVHSEVNQIILAWKMGRQADEVGKAVAELLRAFQPTEDDFLMTSTTTTPVSTTESSTTATSSQPRNYHGIDSPTFWMHATNAAFEHLHDSAQLRAECVAERTAKDFADALLESFDTMTLRTKPAVTAGLRLLSNGTSMLFAAIVGACPDVGKYPAMVHLQEAASRLVVLAKGRTILNTGVNVEYEALKTLIVGGVDVHSELNMLISAVVGRRGPVKVGECLADFLEDFVEELAPDDPSGSLDGAGAQDSAAKDPADADAGGEGASRRSPVVELLQAAWLAASSAEGSIPVPPQKQSSCFEERAADKFAVGVQEAVNEMLKKRKLTMHRGLKQLALSTSQLLGTMSFSCLSDPGAQVVRRCTQKLTAVTRKTMVDYGSVIKYEPMKSLVVAGTPLHIELNEFIKAWQVRGKAESGPAFGRLMHRCSQIIYHEEL